jgi:hypothetical protein
MSDYVVSSPGLTQIIDNFSNISIIGDGDSVEIDGYNNNISSTGGADTIVANGNGDSIITYGSNDNITIGPDSATIYSSDSTVKIYDNNAMATIYGSRNTISGGGHISDYGSYNTFNNLEQGSSINLHGDHATVNENAQVTIFSESTYDTVTGSSMVLVLGPSAFSTAHLIGGAGIDTLQLGGPGSFDLRGGEVQGFERLFLAGSINVILDGAAWTVFGRSNDTVTLGSGVVAVSLSGAGDAVDATLGNGATLKVGDSLVGSGSTLNLSGGGSFDFNLINFSRFPNVNAGANEVLIFGGGDETINGASGGNDTFGFHANNSDTYTINSFVSAGTNHDYIQLDQALLVDKNDHSISPDKWVNEHVSFVGGNWAIQDGMNTIIVVGHNLNPGQDIVFV